MTVRGCFAMLMPAVLALGGCSEDAFQEVRGEYFYNFENAALTPEGKEECWELKGNMSAAELAGAHPTGPWGRSTVVLRGVASPVGKYGNLGTCTRAFTVTEVVSVEHLKQGP